MHIAAGWAAHTARILSLASALACLAGVLAGRV